MRDKKNYSKCNTIIAELFVNSVALATGSFPSSFFYTTQLRKFQNKPFILREVLRTSYNILPSFGYMNVLGGIGAGATKIIYERNFEGQAPKPVDLVLKTCFTGAAAAATMVRSEITSLLIASKQDPKLMKSFIPKVYPPLFARMTLFWSGTYLGQECVTHYNLNSRDSAKVSYGIGASAAFISTMFTRVSADLVSKDNNFENMFQVLRRNVTKDTVNGKKFNFEGFVNMFSGAIHRQAMLGVLTAFLVLFHKNFKEPTEERIDKFEEYFVQKYLTRDEGGNSRQL